MANGLQFVGREPAAAGQFTYPRGRWIRVCTNHTTWLVPRNAWTENNARVICERSQRAWACR